MFVSERFDFIYYVKRLSKLRAFLIGYVLIIALHGHDESRIPKCQCAIIIIVILNQHTNMYDVTNEGEFYIRYTLIS